MSVRSVLLVSMLLAGASCSSDAPAQAPAAKEPVHVGVVTIEPKAITLSRELPGRLWSYRVAEVRARTNGIVLKRLFEEGSDVAEGAPLFQIDPAPYRAALDAAEAQRARAEANRDAAKQLVDRYEKLIETNAISRQELDEAVARHRAAIADVAAARAAIKTARINVDYTTVRAPIAGRIGRAEVTEGAYVQQASATLLATVQQLDTIYVDLSWSSAEMLRIRRAVESGELESMPESAKVTIILEDGREYGTPGTLRFADMTVDPSTGSVALRATVPNPKRELLPGMFVRVRLEEGSKADALLVPQRAVTRDPAGKPYALVVDKANKVERRTLVAERTVGDAWLVTKGIAAGDRVIVEGLQKVRPGVEVVASPAGRGDKAAGSGSGGGKPDKSKQAP